MQLYRVRAKATVPQGLLLTSILMMLALLFVNVTLLTISPDYASFGYQKYVCPLLPIEKKPRAHFMDFLQCNITSPDNPTPCADVPDQILACNMNSPRGQNFHFFRIWGLA